MAKKEIESRERRDFLKKAGLGAGAAGVAAAALTSTEAAEAAVKKGSRSAGYRETDHVKKYYELARF